MKIGRNSSFLGVDKGPKEGPFETIVGNFCSIAEHVFIHGPDNHACIRYPLLVSSFDFGSWGADFTPSGFPKGVTVIENDVWIGEHAQIMSGVIIHSGAIVGAHTVVGKDVPPYAVVVGNPCEIKRFRFPPQVIQALLNIKWWDWSDEEVKERLEDFKDINTFIERYG